MGHLLPLNAGWTGPGSGCLLPLCSKHRQKPRSSPGSGERRCLLRRGRVGGWGEGCVGGGGEREEGPETLLGKTPEALAPLPARPRPRSPPPLPLSRALAGINKRLRGISRSHSKRNDPRGGPCLHPQITAGPGFPLPSGADFSECIYLFSLLAAMKHGGRSGVAGGVGWGVESTARKKRTFRDLPKIKAHTFTGFLSQTA